MNRRDSLALLALLGSALMTSTAFAKDGGDDGGSSDGGSSGSDDSGKGSGKDEPGKDEDNSGKGSGDDKGETPEDKGDDHGGGDDDHDDARRAVERSDALPLAAILEIVKPQLSGTLIDVTLMNRGGELVYRFKYIDPKGTVRRAYFGALTGELR